MDLKAILLVVLWCLSGDVTGNAVEVTDVYPKMVEVEEDQGFLVSYPSEHNKSWTDCVVAVEGTTTPEKYGMNFDNIDTKFGLFTPFSPGNNCGIRVHNVTQKSNGEWIFKATNANAVRQVRMIVNVIPKKTDHKCAASATNHCERWNLANNLRMSCNDPLPMTGWEKRECRITHKGAMRTMVVAEESAASKEETSTGGYTSVQEVDEMKILECSAPKADGPVTMCVIRNEGTGEVFNIQPGLQDTRYSARMTDFTKNRCQFEIPTELTAEEEGKWTMEMTLKSKETHQCQYYLGMTKFVESRKIKAESDIPIDTMEKNVTVECVNYAPYPIRRCYLQSEFMPLFQFSADHEEMAHGNCRFNVDLDKQIDEKKDKNWIFNCGFNGPNTDDPDFIQPFRVRYFENKVIDGKVDTAGNTLECHFIYRTAIKSCVFVSPTKKIISVPSDSYKAEDFDYHGAGFSKGACGLKLKKENLESGQWTCFIDVEGVGDEVNETLHTTEGLLVE